MVYFFLDIDLLYQYCLFCFFSIGVCMLSVCMLIIFMLKKFFKMYYIIEYIYINMGLVIVYFLRSVYIYINICSIVYCFAGKNI